MTGWGQSVFDNNGEQISVTVRCVNARFLELKIRGYDLNPEVEISIRNLVIEFISRGHISITVQHSLKEKNYTFEFDQTKFEELEAVLLRIQREYGRHLEMKDIISSSDLMRSKNPAELNSEVLIPAIEKALIDFNAMRSTEGKNLEKDFITRLHLIHNYLSNLEELSDTIAEQKKERFENKVKEISGLVELDQNRISQEIAILIEKSDFTEETVRCQSHCEQINGFLKDSKPVGKKINFILQEFMRELNTIGSKSFNSEISSIVIELKSEIEKMREQVQNIE